MEVCDMEFEIVMFIIRESVKLSHPNAEVIKVRRIKTYTFWHVFDLNVIWTETST